MNLPLTVYHLALIKIMAKHEKTSHENSFESYDRPYETNVIGLRGVFYFGGFLILLIVLTFGLMYALQNVMEQQAIEAKDAKNPMMMNQTERLPPEPRLQAAPGYEVVTENGHTNLELRAPQSEYRALKAQWEKDWAEGHKDAKTGMVISLPLEEAKAKLLEQSAASTINAEQGQKTLDASRMLYSYSNAGRTAIDKRR